MSAIQSSELGETLIKLKNQSSILCFEEYLVSEKCPSLILDQLEMSIFFMKGFESEGWIWIWAFWLYDGKGWWKVKLDLEWKSPKGEGRKKNTLADLVSFQTTVLQVLGFHLLGSSKSSSRALLFFLLKAWRTLSWIQPQTFTETHLFISCLLCSSLLNHQGFWIQP